MSHYAASSTDHSAEVTIMRATLAIYRERGAADQDPEAALEGVILDAAADLIECHDATGISLDDWTGPKALVHAALEIAGLEPAKLLRHDQHSLTGRKTPC